jgi:hypothetical protein
MPDPALPRRKFVAETVFGTAVADAAAVVVAADWLPCKEGRTLTQVGAFFRLERPLQQQQQQQLYAILQTSDPSSPLDERLLMKSPNTRTNSFATYTERTVCPPAAVDIEARYSISDGRRLMML